MRRFPFLILTLALLGAPATLSAIPLNPLNWFGGDGEEAEEEFLELTSSVDEGRAQDLLASGKASFEAGRLGSANRILKKVTKRYPTSRAAGEAHFMRGQVFMARGRWVKAFESLQRTIAEHPEFENFNRVIAAQFECGTALMEGARGRIFGVIPGFRQYSEAIRQFEIIVINAPYGDYAPLCLMNIALIAQDQEDGDLAIDSLDRLINNYPQSMLAPDAYYNLAVTYSDLVRGPDYDQGSTRQAISYYEDFMILFPESSYIGEVEANLEKMENLLATSRYNLGDFYYRYRNNNTAALVFYNEAITIAPDSEAAEEARTRIADIEAGVRPVTGGSLTRKLLLMD